MPKQYHVNKMANFQTDLSNRLSIPKLHANNSKSSLDAFVNSVERNDQDASFAKTAKNSTVILAQSRGPSNNASVERLHASMAKSPGSKISKPYVTDSHAISKVPSVKRLGDKSLAELSRQNSIQFLKKPSVSNLVHESSMDMMPTLAGSGSQAMLGPSNSNSQINLTHNGSVKYLFTDTIND
jgi:hypothetical protein